METRVAFPLLLTLFCLTLSGPELLASASSNQNDSSPTTSQGSNTANTGTASAKDAPAVDSRRIQNVQPDKMWTRVTQCFLPIYPELALASHTSGTVDIGLCVTKNGDVTGYRVLSGHPLLVNPAVSAISQWKFQPNLGPACSRVRALVRFNADGTTAVEFAHAILADDFGDPGLPNIRPVGQMSDTFAAVPRPETAAECQPAAQPE